VDEEISRLSPDAEPLALEVTSPEVASWPLERPDARKNALAVTAPASAASMRGTKRRFTDHLRVLVDVTMMRPLVVRALTVFKSLDKELANG
jgi:hypothetical protein